MVRLPPPVLVGSKRTQAKSIARSTDNRAVLATNDGSMQRTVRRLQIPPWRIGISTIGGGDVIGGAKIFLICRGRIGTEVIG